MTEAPATPSRKAERARATRAALLAAGRQLFADQGFAATSTEQIVRTARVTRGALYHHHRDKVDLFRAVFEEMETELTARLVEAALAGRSPLDQLRRGYAAFFEACAEPAVRRIVLVDGPSVLGWDEWHEIDARHMFGLVEANVAAAMAAGEIAEQPVAPLAHLIFGAGVHVGLVVARAPDPAAAAAGMAGALDALFDGLRPRV
jgi:AcrR family transcriptional regulator